MNKTAKPIANKSAKHYIFEWCSGRAIEDYILECHSKCMRWVDIANDMTNIMCNYFIDRIREQDKTKKNLWIIRKVCLVTIPHIQIIYKLMGLEANASRKKYE